MSKQTQKTATKAPRPEEVVDAPLFVCEAYLHHRSDVALLEGLPDVPASLPHPSVST